MVIAIVIGVIVVVALVALNISGNARNRERQAVMAAAMGGAVGWPSEQWRQQHAAIGLCPYPSKAKYKDPIHGQAAGAPYTTFLVEHETIFQNMITTWRHTAVVIEGVDRSVDRLDLLSTQGEWLLEFNKKSVEHRRFPSGNEEFDRWYLGLTPNHPDQARPLLTRPVMAAAYSIIQIAPTARIRVNEGAVICWIRGVHDRDSAGYLEVMRLTIELATAINQAAAQFNTGNQRHG
ncbi:hypothetical protein ACFRAQ_28850 [Nocardia sp. NPDC056611]|uniref:hypothetical protein n=1 Tax=Nocardia sp. NPDC056611 TaxID=3345877 RepID=UPI00366D2FC0